MKNLRFLRLLNHSYLLLVLIFAVGCKKNSSSHTTRLFTTLDSITTGIDFTNTLTETRDQNILDYLYFYNGGGVAIGDINNDNLPDIYFTSNQKSNKLYLNKGNFKFEDITEQARVSGSSSWNTGCTMADVNGDGYLDIYVTAVVGINGFIGYNELYINNGDLTFTESAEKYGLDLENYSSQASFFDADNDGDLDVYILNHAVHTTNSFGPASIRNTRNEESGDKLLFFENGVFIDKSEDANIYGGVNSYGLGISTADFNNDGFTDLYISNDFHEDDYYYINKGDGSFTESLSSYFGHTSRFSMGSDVADLNGDGFYDLITLDMLPENENVLKSSAGDDNVNLHKLRIENLGYQPQFTRNMLQINNQGRYFSEQGYLSGVAATDWSWGALFADYNQDGIQDLFISNGIPKRPNDLDYVKYTSNEQIQNKLDKTRLIDQDALNLMPSGAVTNYIFKGHATGGFEKKQEWIINDSIISTGLAYGDLDNDGDLDLVTNNINKPATIYRNDTQSGSYLKIQLQGSSSNRLGIGARAVAYTSQGKQTRQLYTTKGFQSSSEPILHFGFEDKTKIDSLKIIWPSQKINTYSNLELNKTLVVQEENAQIQNSFSLKKESTPWFSKVDDNLGIDFIHTENDYIDFNGQKLLLHKTSDAGPAVSIGDINNDGKEDVIFGSSRFNKPHVYVQTANGFRKEMTMPFINDSLYEETDAQIADFDNDGKNDILMVSGGGEAIGSTPLLFDRLFRASESGLFTQDTLFPQLKSNKSVVIAADFDKDKDIDLFIGSDVVNFKYGATPTSYLLLNDTNKFIPVQIDLFSQLGMVKDAIWDDFDDDGDLDLIVVGEWMTPRFIENRNHNFVDVTTQKINKKINGLWRAINAFDIDNDGDTDYLLGNWGLNSKLTASSEYPMQMFYDDFDNNGVPETILATAKDGVYYPIYGLDELASQLTFLKKKFSTYKEFAGKSVTEVMGEKLLEKARLLEVHTLASGYLENQNGTFTFVPFSSDYQVSPVNDFLSYDFNQDGKQEVLLGGNYFGVPPYLGKFDGFSGALILDKNTLINPIDLGLNLSNKVIKEFNVLSLGNAKYLLVTYNDAPVEIYKLND